MQLVLQSPTDSLDKRAVVVIVYFSEDDLADIGQISALAGDRLSDARNRGEMKGVLYDPTLFHGHDGKSGLLFIGAGARADLDAFSLARVIAAAARYLTGNGYSRFAVLDRGLLTPEEFGRAVTEGAVRGVYESNLKRSDRPAPRTIFELTLQSSRDPDAVRVGSVLGQIVGEAAAIARDLVNLPPNDLNPTTLSSRVRELAASESGLTVEILDEDAMRTLGMGSLLGVSSGSAQPARLIVIHYGDPHADTRLALVGKGLTFDSGGLSLKTAEGMETMKSDMGGGAAVIAGMVAVSRIAPTNISITAYVGATENMPGSAAMRPGDVLTAMSGKTIEVLNTDAEGRLVLADVLTYACRQGATHIVDFATLTGGAVVALGSAATLAVGRPLSWVRRVVQAAEQGLERAWPMPLYEDYRRAMDSDIADLKNTGGRYGSALTAAAFLAEFVEGAEWTHMDIAGTAFADKASPFRPSGGTGEGVGTIVEVVRTLAGS